MITLTYAFKLKPTKQQTAKTENILDVCRSVWNYALRERKDWSTARKCSINSCFLRSEFIISADAPYPNFAAQCKSLTQAKLKLQEKIGKLHERAASARKDWQFKLAHLFCNQADNIFVEDINFTSWSRGVVCKQSLDSGIGGFINQILPYVAWKRGKYYAKVDKNHTSQTCPNCGCRTGKKKLSVRVHKCSECGYQASRDVAAAKVIAQRGKTAVGQPVVYKNACGDDATGFKQLNLLELVGNL